MATPTTYRNYLKPATGETYDVNLLDTNYDKIDTDVNYLIKVKHAEFISTTGSQTSGAGINFGTLNADGAKTQNNTFCTVDTTGKITFNEVGVYFVHAKVSPTVSYTSMQIWALDQGGTNQIAATGTGYNGLPATANCTVFVDTIGQTLQMGATWNSTSPANTRTKVTKIQG